MQDKKVNKFVLLPVPLEDCVAESVKAVFCRVIRKTGDSLSAE